MISEPTDFLVIGSGLSGLAVALKLAGSGSVLIVSKTSVVASNSAMAQGGIAAAVSVDDSFEEHLADTLTAGAGLCSVDVVEQAVSMGPERIQDLLDWGVEFDRDGLAFDLAREGGHKKRRILHVADQTGAAIHQTLLRRAQEHPRISFLENHLVMDLITSRHVHPVSLGGPSVYGAYVLNLVDQKPLAIVAQQTILATGGAGRIYLYTSNWSGATGDGIAMAYRAGARVANMEFMQFHPTCLYHPQERHFLLTEALRGEGGVLEDAKGNRFMDRYHPQGSLAPRDIVARGIDSEMKRSGSHCVYLNISSKSENYLKSRFPFVYTRCLELGFDMSRQPIPVVPAAHYLCGGVLTSISGQTDLQRLWVLGEAACTGLHGANRLASNSLLECLVTAHCCSEEIKRSPAQVLSHQIPDLDIPGFQNPDELNVIHHLWDEIRRTMWNYVGVVRSTRRLSRAAHRLDVIQQEFEDYYLAATYHPTVLELRSLLQVSQLTVQCAMARKESRGIHYSLDFPDTLATAANTII